MYPKMKEAKIREFSEACIMSFLSYFHEPEDYLNVYTDTTVTFEDILIFMSALRDTRE